MIADQFTTVLLDLDGVVYVGDTLVPGARAALRRLRGRGTTLRFLTNDPRPTRRDLVARLEGFGIEAHEPEIVTCGWATAQFLRRDEIQSAYVVGSEGLREELTRADLQFPDDEEVEAVVVGCDEGVCYPDLRRAAQLIRRGARFIATNNDATFPTPEGPAPATGSIVAAVRTASRSEPHVVGKPHSAMFEAALRDRDPAEAVMIGDRLATDVRGAHQQGIATVLVTGTPNASQQDDETVTPDAVVASLSDLLQ
jgi:HAD superfamily hydrolase (TIGR01450 family)